MVSRAFKPHLRMSHSAAPETPKVSALVFEVSPAYLTQFKQDWQTETEHTTLRFGHFIGHEVGQTVFRPQGAQLTLYLNGLFPYQQAVSTSMRALLPIAAQVRAMPKLVGSRS